MASVSVAWAVMGGLMSVFWFYVQADWTPFRVICAWYAMVGGAAAAVQVFALVLADGAVKRTQHILEEQFEEINQAAAMAWQSDNGPRDAAHATLQSAADGIRTELDVYRLAPERRFFSLFGMPVGQVFVSVSTLVLGQAAAYSWTALKQAADDGSQGDYADCTSWMREFKGC